MTTASLTTRTRESASTDAVTEAVLAALVARAAHAATVADLGADVEPISTHLPHVVAVTAYRPDPETDATVRVREPLYVSAPVPFHPVNRRRAGTYMLITTDLVLALDDARDRLVEVTHAFEADQEHAQTAGDIHAEAYAQAQLTLLDAAITDVEWRIDDARDEAAANGQLTTLGHEISHPVYNEATEVVA